MSIRDHAIVVLSLIIGLCLLHTASVFEPGRLTDERFYEPAIEEAVAGRSPYDVPGFLYPPTFARTGRMVYEILGPSGSRYALRAFNLFGLVFILWFTMVRGIKAVQEPAFASTGRATATPVWALVALSVALLLTPGVGLGVFVGNFSFLVGAIAILGIWLADRRPVLAGVLLGATLVTKPLIAGGLPLFLLPRPRNRTAASFLRRLHARRVAAALIAVFLAIGLLWVDRQELVQMLAAEPPELDKKRSLSIYRIARELGFGELRIPLFTIVTAVLALAFWGRIAGRRHLLIAALLAVPLTTLVVWGHTLVLFYPVAAMALGRWIARRRAEGLSGVLAGEPPHRLETVIVLGATAVLVFAHPGGFAGEPGIVQALLLAPPLLAPVALATYWFRTMPVTD